MKNYIITVAFGGMQKRLWFAGEATAEAEQAFHDACESLDDSVSAAADWTEFLRGVIEHFRSRGFMRIAR